MKKLLIQNGLICDGTGNTPYHADLLVVDSKISLIQNSVQSHDAELIDAGGKIVSPGFIDIHRHCDSAALYDKTFGELELAQGITTVVCGNCGLSPFPSAPATRSSLFDFIEPCLGVIPRDIPATTVPEYLSLLQEQDMKLNIGTLAATGAVRVAVKGWDKSPFTAAELEKACTYLDEALAGGALGLSMGIMYTPECFTTAEEYAAMVRIAKKHDAIVSCHIRGEGDNLLSSVEEIIGLARATGAELNISHFKATGLKNWHDKINRAIEKIEAARAEGLKITVDFYPYTGGSTTLLSLLPPTVLESDTEHTLAKLSTQAGKDKLREELYKEHAGWDNMVTAIGWERIVISSVTMRTHKAYCGKSVLDASHAMGCKDPADFVCDLLCEEAGKVGIIVLSMAEEDVDTVAALPYSIVISDSLYGVSDTPHPRLYASFPKILRAYVREKKTLSVEGAIAKMTGMPAERLKLPDRGILKPGNIADIAIYDLERVLDNAVFGDSKHLASGMDYVFVNGKLAWNNNKVQNHAAGAVLKNKR